MRGGENKGQARENPEKLRGKPWENRNPETNMGKAGEKKSEAEGGNPAGFVRPTRSEFPKIGSCK